MLDADLLREPAVKHHLNRALDMMNHAVAGTFQPGARENMAYLISTERRYVLIKCHLHMDTSESLYCAFLYNFRTQSSIQNAVSAPATVSFKDVIEKMVCI